MRGEIGSGERRVRELFAEAKRSTLSIIFIDEFHAVFTSREEGIASASDVGATLSLPLYLTASTISVSGIGTPAWSPWSL